MRTVGLMKLPVRPISLLCIGPIPIVVCLPRCVGGNVLARFTRGVSEARNSNRDKVSIGNSQIRAIHETVSPLQGLVCLAGLNSFTCHLTKATFVVVGLQPLGLGYVRVGIGRIR